MILYTFCHKWIPRLSAVFLAVIVAALGLGVPASANVSAPECVKTQVPVRLEEGGAPNYTIYGELCQPRHTKPSTVQLLVHGGTYNHNYWDIPYNPDQYSYVRYMVDSGHAVFNIDRLGHGNSSRAPSPKINVPADAFHLHQIVQKLRDGAIAGQPFRKVALVGHSVGTTVAMTEAARYKDVDGLIATSIQHKINLAALPYYNGLLWPALEDPRMRDRDPGYTSTRPGSRGSPLFYNKGHYDPGVVDADEKYAKDSYSVAEFATFPLTILDGTTRGIQANTLNVTGSEDQIFCGPLGSDCANSQALQQQEKPYYPNADLTSYVLPNAGHSINMHDNAHDWFRIARDWLSTI